MSLLPAEGGNILGKGIGQGSSQPRTSICRVSKEVDSTTGLLLQADFYDRSVAFLRSEEEVSAEP